MENRNIADQLGFIQAQIAELKAQEVLLRNELVEKIGDEQILTIEGELFQVTFSATHTVKTNWKAVAEKLRPSRQLIAAHSVPADSFRLNVRARSAQAA